MYCIKCGCQLSDDAVFCYKCGTKLLTDAQTPGTQVSSGSSELDREALKIYLQDILSLECIKSKYIKSINAHINKINSIDTQSYKKIYTFEDSDSWSCNLNSLYFKYQNGRYYLGMVRDFSSYPGVGWSDHDEFDDPNSYCYYYLNIEANFEMLTRLSTWTDYRVVLNNKFFEKRQLGKKAMDAFLRSYEDFKQCCAAGLQTQNIEVNKLKAYKNGLISELNAVEKMLRKAYSINVIPAPFRNNIYAIYYLYDFIRTSNQSLATALLHYDLNEIKTKLDKIIAQQQEIIIQQSIMLAQNQQLMEQNQQHLKTLASIESNTAQAAQYSAIAASNAEACAWIGLANYLKQ